MNQEPDATYDPPVVKHVYADGSPEPDFCCFCKGIGSCTTKYRNPFMTRFGPCPLCDGYGIPADGQRVRSYQLIGRLQARHYRRKKLPIEFRQPTKTDRMEQLLESGDPWVNRARPGYYDHVQGIRYHPQWHIRTGDHERREPLNLAIYAANWLLFETLKEELFTAGSREYLYRRLSELQFLQHGGYNTLDLIFYMASHELMDAYDRIAPVRVRWCSAYGGDLHDIQFALRCKPYALLDEAP